MSNEYIKKCLETENFNPIHILTNIRNEDTCRLLHASVGFTTEAGEFTDQLKRHLFRGSPIDAVNLAEELGDLFWYAAIAADALGIDFETVQEMNATKLANRYKGRTSNKDASDNRDLVAERKILEDIFTKGVKNKKIRDLEGE